MIQRPGAQDLVGVVRSLHHCKSEGVEGQVAKAVLFVVTNSNIIDRAFEVNHAYTSSDTERNRKVLWQSQEQPIDPLP